MKVGLNGPIVARTTPSPGPGPGGNGHLVSVSSDRCPDKADVGATLDPSGSDLDASSNMQQAIGGSHQE